MLWILLCRFFSFVLLVRNIIEFGFEFFQLFNSFGEFLSAIIIVIEVDAMFELLFDFGQATDDLTLFLNGFRLVVFKEFGSCLTGRLQRLLDQWVGIGETLQGGREVFEFLADLSLFFDE